MQRISSFVCFWGFLLSQILLQIKITQSHQWKKITAQTHTHTEHIPTFGAWLQLTAHASCAPARALCSSRAHTTSCVLSAALPSAGRLIKLSAENSFCRSVPRHKRSKLNSVCPLGLKSDGRMAFADSVCSLKAMRCGHRWCFVSPDISLTVWNDPGAPRIYAIFVLFLLILSGLCLCSSPRKSRRWHRLRPVGERGHWQTDQRDSPDLWALRRTGRLYKHQIHDPHLSVLPDELRREEGAVSHVHVFKI